MPRARKELVSLTDTPYYHCVSRCVRRSFLCGEDRVSGKSFAHRKGWIVDRLAVLREIFAVEICAYAVMSNHYHVVLRVDHERARGWTEAEVMNRWSQFCGLPLLVARYQATQEKDAEPLPNADAKVARECIETFRARLCDLSWFMRGLNETIARQANREDKCKGRFWEGRFKSQALLDDIALLSAMMYVDLNPIRAGLAELPEAADYTAIRQRIKALAENLGQTRVVKDHSEVVKIATGSNEETLREPALMPFMDEVEKSECETSAVIPYTFRDYLELIDWTGRAIREDKKGAIPPHAPPILQRLKINPLQWVRQTQYFGIRFPCFAGCVSQLRKMSEKLNRTWLHGMSAARALREVSPLS